LASGAIGRTAFGVTSSSNGAASPQLTATSSEAIPPRIINPDGFLVWFEARRPELVATNNL